ncbi:hypothetical protein AMJ57_01530 [Parcubacteria bacterium SG8_24]|nr:MAG: hypothetical protein AMJ57_01530 [Parcubacteria bacterium SG8_24]
MSFLNVTKRLLALIALVFIAVDLGLACIGRFDLLTPLMLKVPCACYLLVLLLVWLTRPRSPDGPDDDSNPSG